MTPLVALTCTCGLVIIGALLRNVLILLGRYAALGLGTFLAFRATQIALPEVTTPNYWQGMLIGGVFGFIVVGVLCGALIRHTLIKFYLQRSLQRDKDAAQAGKLW